MPMELYYGGELLLTISWDVIGWAYVFLIYIAAIPLARMWAICYPAKSAHIEAGLIVVLAPWSVPIIMLLYCGSCVVTGIGRLVLIKRRQ